MFAVRDPFPGSCEPSSTAYQPLLKGTPETVVLAPFSPPTLDLPLLADSSRRTFMAGFLTWSFPALLQPLVLMPLCSAQWQCPPKAALMTPCQMSLA